MERLRMPTAGWLVFALLFVIIFGVMGGQVSAQALSFDIVDEPFDAIGFFRNMLGPIGNLVMEKRPIAWTATVAGIKMDGYGAMYITTYPPDFEGIAQRIPILGGFNPFQNEAETEERTDIFIIELLHPFLRGSNNFNGAFAGKAGPRRIAIPSWSPYEEADARDYPDRAYLNLEFSASSPLAVKDDPNQSYSVYGDQGALVVYEMDRGFYATARALLKPSVPVLGNAPFREAVIDFRLCEVAPEDEGGVFGQVPCLVGDVFQVLEHWPEAHRENVDYKFPAIRIAFSDTLSSVSLEDNVEVFTMSSNGDKLKVPGTAGIVGGNELTFVPHEPLLDGVIYEVRIKGGEEGIRSVHRTTLPDDFAWRFSTVIDIEKRFNPEDFHGVVDDDFPADGPVQSFVYQTVRDGTLIPGKPTLTRIYVHWKAYEHIAADWQPTSFRAEVRVEDSHDGPIYTHIDRPYRIHRGDQFTASDRRFALNTVNLFNWRPMLTSEGTMLTVTVEPENVYPQRNEDYMFEEVKFIGRWPHASKHMVFDYFMLPIGDWADDISAEDLRLAQQISRATETHLVQLFPIGSARGRNMGTPVGNMGDWRTVSELIEDGIFAIVDTTGSAADLRKIDAIKRMMQRIHNVHGPRTNADVLVGFIPLSYYSEGRALSSIQYDWSTYDEIPSGVDFFRRTVFLPVWSEGPFTMGLAHEIGHTYHLDHEPVSETAEQRAAVAARWQTGHYPGISGFRMASSGAFGWNKSSRDGNAEDPSTLLSFMFPVSRMHTETFISNNHYDSLLTTFLNEALRRSSARHALPSVQVAAVDPLAHSHALAMSLSQGRQPDTGLMMIAGYIHKEAPVIFIDAVRRRVEYARDMETGPYAAVLLDEEGVALARQPFGEYIITGFADDDDDPWMYFQVYLPESERAHRIEIWEGDTLLTAWERPDQKPEVHFLPTSGSDQSGYGQMGTPHIGPIDIDGMEPVTVNWEGNDDHLAYTLLYSSDGGFPWTTLVADTPETSFDIDPRRLSPGDNPTLRLIAGNGFDEAEAIVAITLRRDLEATWLYPMADVQADPTDATMAGLIGPMLDVEVTFSTDLDAGSVEGRVRLTNAAGVEIPAAVVYDENVQVVRLTPEDPLPGGPYTMTLQPGIIDRYGNGLQTKATLTFVVTEGDGESDAESPLYTLNQSSTFFDHLPPVNTGMVVPAD